MREGNERVVQAITDGFNKLSAAMVANAPPVKEASAPAYPPVPPPTMPPGTPPAGSSVTSTYGLPGYASSYGMPTPNADTQCADTQCADDQHTTDAGKSASDFDGVNGKYSNSACCCHGCKE